MSSRPEVPLAGLVWCSVADLRPGPWTRDLVERHVEALAAAGAYRAPVLVTVDGMVIDGWHRVAAARRCGVRELECQFSTSQGLPQRVAELVRHQDGALPLGPGDRRRLARLVLEADPRLSDNAVMGICRVGRATVRRVRAELHVGPLRSEQQLTGSERRVGRDGRQRPSDPHSVRESIRRRLIEQPQASARSIARELNVSHNTVTRVRRDLSAEPIRRGRGGQVLARVLGSVRRAAGRVVRALGAVRARWSLRG